MDNDFLTLPECVICSRKICLAAPIWKLDICEYGISFVNDGESIQRANASGTLRHLSQNLRHELSKVLQILISEACKIDPTISSRRIISSNPASRIVGAALIIDNFINMISGVNDFHVDIAQKAQIGTQITLVEIIEKCFDIYGIISNTHRTTSLRAQINVPQTIRIQYATAIVEYLVAVLIDNIYKHAIDGSLIRVSAENETEDTVDLVFENPSKTIQQPDRIFAKGYQEKQTSDGFGFGLFWAQILADNYNSGIDSSTCRVEIQHTQETLSEDYQIAQQRFIISNLRIFH